MKKLIQLREWIVLAQPDSVSDIIERLDSMIGGKECTLPDIYTANFKKDSCKQVTKVFLDAFDKANTYER